MISEYLPTLMIFRNLTEAVFCKLKKKKRVKHMPLWPPAQLLWMTSCVSWIHFHLLNALHSLP